MKRKKTLTQSKQGIQIESIKLTYNEVHSHNTKNNYNMVYFLHGTSKCKIKGTEYYTSRFNYLLLKPHERITFLNCNKDIVNVLSLSFSQETASKISPDETILEAFKEEILKDKRLYTSQSLTASHIRALAMQLHAELNANNPASEVYINGLMSIILTSIHRVYLEDSLSNKNVIIKGLRIDDIMNYVMTHLSEEISLDKLAEGLFFSKYYILHQFKKQTGTSLYSYILKRKLDYSKKLIEDGITINEVYKQCGFGDYSNFFRSFKKEFSCTPKQYYNQLNQVQSETLE